MHRPIHDFSPAVYVVDDDTAMRRLLRAELEHAGHLILEFADATQFLDEVSSRSAGCVVLDINMPGIDGKELQSLMLARKIRLPIIFLSGIVDVPTTATVMKQGAFDVLEKPYAPEVLLATVRAALQLDATARSADEKTAVIRRRLAELTPRELEVAERVARGLANKQIALALNISQRTVEIHRARVMDKMQTGSVAEFVLAWTAGQADAA